MNNIRTGLVNVLCMYRSMPLREGTKSISHFKPSLPSLLYSALLFSAPPLQHIPTTQHTYSTYLTASHMLYLSPKDKQLPLNLLPRYTQPHDPCNSHRQSPNFPDDLASVGRIQLCRMSIVRPGVCIPTVRRRTEEIRGDQRRGDVLLLPLVT